MNKIVLLSALPCLVALLGCRGKVENKDDVLPAPTESAPLPDAPAPGPDADSPDTASEAEPGIDAVPQPDAAVPTLTVALADNNPAGKTLCVGEQATIVTFTFTNESDADLTVMSLRLRRTGIGFPTDFIFGGISGDYVHLGIPDSSGIVKFEDMQFPIHHKTSAMLAYWIQAGTQNGGGTLAIEIPDADSITVKGGAKIAGSFPVKSNTFTLSSVSCDAPDVGTDASPASATYCEPWTDPASQVYFGYQGCCGTFEKTSVPPKVGSLIKGSEPVVYYYASNGKKYVFTTTNDLESWYAPLDQYGIPTYAPELVCGLVKEVTDDDLAHIAIGGSVTIRPGTFITGIVEAPTRYAISKGHVLRLLAGLGNPPIFPEPTLAMRLRLTPDFELVNYVVGTDVYGPADYDRLAELQVTIEQDLGITP